MARHGDQVNGLPLKGFVLCSTSLPQDQRITLSDYATEMGAVYRLDLTADVTHLLVGDIRTPKFRYVAKARPDISVLQPEWVEEVRRQWLTGDDVDIAKIEQDHKCPAFLGLMISVTGFSNIDERAKLEEMITQHGARYSGDLTKQVTHLVVAEPQGAKYTHARQWQIPCVSLKWLLDSIKRGMMLEEGLYDPLLPVEEQGNGAIKIDQKPRATTSKRRRDDESQDDGAKRKFRRTASVRLETHSQDLWQDISVANAGQDVTKTDQWREGIEEAAPVVTTGRRELPIAERSIACDGLFSTWRMCLQGFSTAKKDKLRQVLETQCGATIVESTADLQGEGGSRCMLVPHDPPQSLYYLSQSTGQMIIATEWWVERCIHAKRIIEPSSDPLSKPLWSSDLPNMSGTNVSSTGLNSIDLRQMALVVKAVGAVYQEQLAPTTTVLISGTDKVRKEKAFYAKKHNIPIVKPDWLWQSIRSKRKLQTDSFILLEDSPDHDRSSGETASRPRSRLSGSGALQTTAALPLKAHKPAPFVHEDDSSQTSEVRHASEDVLKERSTNISSPRKTSQQDPNGKSEDAGMAAAADTNTTEDLNLDIASLSRQLHQSRSGISTADAVRKRKRTLGRAASAISNKSVSISAEPSLEEAIDLWDDSYNQEQTALVHGPSTQLGYEVPEAEAHRLQMAERMGVTVDESVGKKLASLGTVRDTDAGSNRPRRQRAR